MAARLAVRDIKDQDRIAIWTNTFCNLNKYSLLLTTAFYKEKNMYNVHDTFSCAISHVGGGRRSFQILLHCFDIDGKKGAINNLPERVYGHGLKTFPY